MIDYAPVSSHNLVVGLEILFGKIGMSIASWGDSCIYVLFIEINNCFLPHKSSGESNEIYGTECLVITVVLHVVNYTTNILIPHSDLLGFDFTDSVQIRVLKINQGLK